MKKTPEFVRCIPYKRLYNIPYASKFPIDDTYGLEILKQQQITTKCPKNFRGQATYNLNHFIEPTQILVSKHIKNTMRNKNQIKHLASIVEVARAKKHKVFIVLPPYRSDYLRCLPEQQVVFRELFDFLQKNPDVTLLNFQQDTDFTDSDFDSPDHCNKQGGKKLTNKIKQML